MARHGFGEVGFDATLADAELGWPRPASNGAKSVGAQFVPTKCEKLDSEIEAPVGVSLGLPS